MAVPSLDLFRLQDQEYQDTVVTKADRFNSTYVTNRSRRVMRDWVFNPLADEYALSSDRDDSWRPGGSIAEVCIDAGIDPESIAKGVVAFAEDPNYRGYAEATELPLGTVKSRLNRARLELASSVRRRVHIQAVPPAEGLAGGSA